MLEITNLKVNDECWLADSYGADRVRVLQPAQALPYSVGLYVQVEFLDEYGRIDWVGGEESYCPEFWPKDWQS